MSDFDFGAMPEGATYIKMVQKQNGKKIGLDIVVNASYDWNAIKENACSMVDVIQKYKQDYKKERKTVNG